MYCFSGFSVFLFVFEGLISQWDFEWILGAGGEKAGKGLVLPKFHVQEQRSLYCCVSGHRLEGMMLMLLLCPATQQTHQRTNKPLSEVT